LMFSWLTQETQNICIFWATIISAIILVLGLIISTILLLKRKHRLSNLYKIYADLKQIQVKEKSVILKKDLITLTTSPNPQTIKITLRMESDATVVFIALSFEGNGQKPDMKKPYDYQFNKPHLGAEYSPFLDNGWNITFRELGHRNIGQKIRIGFECIASTLWDGYLKVNLSCEGGTKKTYKLPISVINTAL